MLNNYLSLKENILNTETDLSQWNVLVVDDDSDIHVVTRFCLSHTVIGDRSLKLFDAYSARDAIELLKGDFSIDLVLLDVVMENPVAGLEVARWLHEDAERPNTPKIILRTGQPGSHQMSEIGKNRYIDAVLEKSSTTYNKLISTISALLLDSAAQVVRH